MRMSTSWPGRADAGETLAICEQAVTMVGRDGCGRGPGSIVSCAAAGPVRTASDAAIASPVAIAARAGCVRVISDLAGRGEGGLDESPAAPRGPIGTPGGSVVP